MPRQKKQRGDVCEALLPGMPLPGLVLLLQDPGTATSVVAVPFVSKDAAGQLRDTVALPGAGGPIEGKLLWIGGIRSVTSESVGQVVTSVPTDSEAWKVARRKLAALLGLGSAGVDGDS